MTMQEKAGIAGHGYYFEDLAVGMEASHAKTITEADIETFAALSGDTNPVHMSDDFAAKTIFKRRIAHGILTASLLSPVLGTKLPGPGCIYISQSLGFKAPVYIGEEVVATARIVELVPEKGRVKLTCDCAVDGKKVIEGEAVLMVLRREA